MGTSVGKQGVPEKEKDPSVSKPDDKDTEESVLPSSIKIEYTNKINVSQQEEHSSKLEDNEENSTESILTEKSKEPASEHILIRPGLLKVIVFEASELVNKDMTGKS